MAERKSGPVKPPVIDLTAREAPEPDDSGSTAAPPRAASGRFTRAATPATPAEPAAEDRAAADGLPPEAAAAAEPAAAAAATPPPEPEPAATEPQAAPQPPRPQARLAMPWSAISIAAVAGAVIGVGLTYALANLIALPRQAPAFPDPAPQLSELTDRALALDARLAALEEAAIDSRVAADATLVQLDTATTDLRQQVADLRTLIPESQPAVDLTAIEQQLQTLEGRVGAIAAGASSADASALAENLTGLEQEIAALTGQLAELGNRVAAGDTAVAALRTEVEDTKTALAAQSRTLGGADIGPAVKLPLIVSGLESAFANGRSYAAELSGLTALLPDLAVPATLSAHAETGLARPDALLARFAAQLPDILAGRTGESTGDWTQDAIEWAKALLALRPAEEMEGDTPEAIVSRLEGAMERRDFVAAAALLAQLPAPMRTAAGDVGTDVAALAEAETFVARLRTDALAPDAAAAATGAEPAT
jgi:hypothetical protein